MIRFPHAKINLGLKVSSKRSDGYHDIVSILYPIGLSDMLEIIPSERKVENATLDVSGDPTHRVSEDDLLLRAFRGLPERTKLYNPQIHIHKQIPIGAGLGGGSSDAAQLIRHFSGQELDAFDPNDLFARVASRIGSDVPFFLQDRPALVSGRGERMTPFDLDLGGWHLLVLVPPFQVSTAKAYKGASTDQAPFPHDLSSRPVEEWKNFLKNDLEHNVLRTNPALKQLKDQLYRSGASYASMSGSGSGVYGLFSDTPPEIPDVEDHFVWHEELASLT